MCVCVCVSMWDRERQRGKKEWSFNQASFIFVCFKCVPLYLLWNGNRHIWQPKVSLNREYIQKLQLDPGLGSLNEPTWKSMCVLDFELSVHWVKEPCVGCLSTLDRSGFGLGFGWEVFCRIWWMAACANLGGKGQYGLASLPRQPHQLVIGTICQADGPLHNVHLSVQSWPTRAHRKVDPLRSSTII